MPAEQTSPANTPHEHTPPAGEAPRFGYIGTLDDIQRIINNPLQNERVINVFGMPRMGKSVLLQEIADQNTTDPDHPVRVFSVRNYFGQYGLFQTAVFFDNILAHYGYTGSFNDALHNKYMHALEKTLAQHKRPPVLIIDDYDLIPRGHPGEELENYILPAIIRTAPSAAIVLGTTDRPTFNRSLFMDQGTWHTQLLGIREQDLRQTLPSGYQRLIPQLLEHSAGIPSILTQLLDKIQADPQSDFAAPEVFTGLLDEEYVELARTATFTPHELAQGPDSPEGLAQQMLLPLSIVRRFHVDVVRKLIPELFPHTEVNKSTSFKMIGALGNRASWIEEEGYTIASPLKDLYSHLLERTNPDQVREIHEAMVSITREQLQQRYHSSYLVTLLHHQARLAHMDHTPDDTIRAQLMHTRGEFTAKVEGKERTTIDQGKLNEALMQDETLAVYFLPDTL